MKYKMKHFAIVLICAVFALTAGLGCAGKSDQEAMSIAQRALDMQLVQNTMSKHAYYHAAGKHIEELNDLWVSMDGPYAETAKWSNPTGIWEGMELIMEFYGVGKENTKKRALEQISKIYPEVENIPENLGAGDEWVIHTQTTPIIEVAGDGKTAKGIWYSPGISQSAQIRDGKVTTRGGWFWEKYACDFVKENGEWKLWHLQTFYDNTPPGWSSDDSASQGGPGAGGPGQGAPEGAPGGQGGPQGGPPAGGGEQAQAPAAPGPSTAGNMSLPSATRPNPEPYEAWSPTSVPKIQPKFPEPYYTFDETFSY